MIKPFKPLPVPARNSTLPYFTLVISMIILGALAYGLYAVWDKTNFPTGIPADQYNRFGTGCLAPSLAFTGYGMLESFRELRTEYNALEIKEGKPSWSCCASVWWMISNISLASTLWRKYFGFILFSVIGSSIWNGATWGLSALVDLFLAPFLPGAVVIMLSILRTSNSLDNATDIFINFFLMWVVGKIAAFVQKMGEKKMQEKKDEELPLITDIN